MKHNFKNLNIWKLAIELANDAYILTDCFPKNEEFGLKSQLRRCSVSVASNIAEGSSRSSNKDFNRFLEISLGSLYELQTQIIISSNRSYFDLSKLENIENKITELQRMISGFQKKLKL
ncbi:four helix bundle protein [Chryseobacterium soldanellicola]|uniref:Four helix bundle protein n=1 Tax=Chryseobacterium soldanellicola TaxID=311333 RepID=A0A1H1GJC8_9FLAO|nr:four helix bundle protein [Chryseobacterium soldanellicola]SDR12988.1 four helix bundle protein [Chryseobacterium soldanellicola]